MDSYKFSDHLVTISWGWDHNCETGVNYQVGFIFGAVFISGAVFFFKVIFIFKVGSSSIFGSFIILESPSFWTSVHSFGCLYLLGRSLIHN